MLLSLRSSCFTSQYDLTATCKRHLASNIGFAAWVSLYIKGKPFKKMLFAFTHKTAQLDYCTLLCAHVHSTFESHFKYWIYCRTAVYEHKDYIWWSVLTFFNLFFIVCFLLGFNRKAQFICDTCGRVWNWCGQMSRICIQDASNGENRTFTLGRWHWFDVISISCAFVAALCLLSPLSFLFFQLWWGMCCTSAHACVRQESSWAKSAMLADTPFSTERLMTRRTVCLIR